MGKTSTKQIKLRVYEIIEKAEVGDIASKVFDSTILILIIATVASIVLESFDTFATTYENQLAVFQVLTISVFTIEYLLRIWTAELEYPGMPIKRARIKYIFSFMAVVDLMAILPFYLPFIIKIDLRFLRIIRLTRIFRLFKLNRYSNSIQLIGKVMKKSKDELLTTVYLVSFLVLISSILMYNVENAVQPDQFPNVVATLWWSIATLTTVGYGDVYPITALGKVLASVIALAGIGIVALPTGIISSGFVKEISKNATQKCPNCGHEFKDES